jgi:hypothetical protein
MSEAHVKAIGEFEIERLNARDAEGWLPLHPTSASVSRDCRLRGIERERTRERESEGEKEREGPREGGG